MKIIIFNNRKFSKKKEKRNPKKTMKRVVFSYFIILFVKIRKKMERLKLESNYAIKKLN